MPKPKIILFIVISLILACLLFFGGTYFAKLSVECPCQKEIQPSFLSDMIKNWRVFYKGELTEIGSDYFVLISEDNQEIVRLNISPSTEYRQQKTSQPAELLQEKFFELAQLQDFRTGDLVCATVDLLEDDYSLVRVSKIIPLTK